MIFCRTILFPKALANKREYENKSLENLQTANEFVYNKWICEIHLKYVGVDSRARIACRLLEKI